jgi:6-methylsalicylate decarboxylase
LLSNHEGYYLGNRSFTPFFADLNSSKHAIFVHPTGPCLHSANGSLIDANPTPYPEGFVEYYYETARTFMDLTISQTVANFTSLRWIVPHGGGSFPSIEDRFITSQPPAVLASSKAAYSTRYGRHLVTSNWHC